MTINEQAKEACDKWIEWVVKEGGDYWLWGDIPDEAMAEWIPGYLHGVENRLANAHGDDSSDQMLWNYAEDMSLFKQSGFVGEIVAKCYAAGYLAGYKSIGGKHDHSNDN
jgi:hypothetical protein